MRLFLALLLLWLLRLGNCISSSDSHNDCPSSTLSSSSGSSSTMSSPQKYEQDGVAAKEIAQYLPYFPFKGIPRFYDIGGFLYEPEVFQRIVDIFVERYREIGIDMVAG